MFKWIIQQLQFLMDEDFQFSRLDRAFSHFLAQRTPFINNQKNDFESLCARLSFQQTQGHSCIYVNTNEQDLIIASGLASESDLTPLILEQNRLYLHRYWFYEDRLSRQLRALITHTFPAEGIESVLLRYFKEQKDEWQKKAAKMAITHGFSIITGGPGTGKTSTVVKILAILQELAFNKDTFLQIALAAPTGKAAMRLQESINVSKNTLPCSESIIQKIPETVSTLHRLLGPRFSSPYFKHNSNFPFTYDLVVVDEASMIDLALMSKLVDALKPGSKLLLLGDKDQLASVESGAVLANLTAALPEQTVKLKKPYRFQREIKALANAVNMQAKEVAWKLLEDGQQVSMLEENLDEYAAKQYTSYLEKIEKNRGYNVIFSAFNQFQILCSNRHGEYGVIKINKLVEKKLNQQNKIQLSGQWYVGRPIMVIKNNTAMKLYNGDIGICLYDKDSEKLAVFFQCSDGEIKKILPTRVPAHETAFAMTIHKSQGSEFEECLCVLPDKINPVLSKELIYTAITRAREKLKILSSYTVFCYALEQKIDRTGGLFEKLTRQKNI